MNADIRIYRMSVSVEDNRPAIDFRHPTNAKNDWQRCDEVLRGLRAIKDQPEICITVNDVRATSWDLHLLPGSFGLFSQRAIDVMGANALRHFDLLHVWLNNTDYFILHCKKALPCLNRSDSIVVPFVSNPGRIKEIQKYVFDKNAIDDPLCFCIPESRSGLFVTEAVRKSIANAHLRGCAFEAVG